METKNLLAAKLAKILGEIGKVEKTGRNDFHKYDYVTENDLVYAVRGKLAEAGIFVFESTESQHVEIIEQNDGKKMLLTTVTTKHTFVDGESGESFSVLSQGQGSDNGDKGGYKAITGAMKYFLYKCFMIPTGDDPEADPETDRRTTSGVNSKSAVANRPAAARQEPTQQRSASPGNSDPRAQFRDRKWTGVVLHFTKNKGKTLGELGTSSLRWYCFDWTPKAFGNKPISEEDVLLRAACDVAIEEEGLTPHQEAPAGRA